MKKIQVFSFLLIVCCCAFACKTSNEESVTNKEIPTEEGAKAKRIISLSGFLTEVLHELGHSDKIVGRDVTSTHPAKIAKIPNLGHISQLNAEAIIALEPNLIFVEEGQAKKTNVFEQIKAAGIEIVQVPTSYYFNNPVQAAEVIGRHLSIEPAKSQQLKDKIHADSLQLSTALAAVKKKPKVLFIYARGAGRMMVGGKATSAAAMIEKAGGVNAIQSFDDFRAMSSEALLEAAPDAILMFKSGLASLDGKAGLAQIAGMKETPAFKQDKIIAMDGHALTSFGVQAGPTALALAKVLHSLPTD